MFKAKFNLKLADSHHTSDNTWNIFILLSTHYSKISVGALDNLI